MSQRVRSGWLAGAMNQLRMGEIARPTAGFRQALVLGLAGLFMVAASFIPWQLDPLGSSLSAWQLPLEFGWQLPANSWSGLLSYGMVCLGCALLIWWQALSAWRSRTVLSKKRCRMLALVCLLPLLLFVTQFLYMDMGRVVQLLNGENQMLLIRSKLGYNSPPQFVKLEPFEADPLMLDSRIALLVNQLTGGAFVPLLSVLVLLVGQRFFAPPVAHRLKRWQLLCLAVLLLIGLGVMGRAPAALACMFEADHLLVEGNYAGVLTWLDRAVWLNPSLDQVPGYHLKRGQAHYFLYPDQPDAESIAYRAAFYRQQRDLLTAYQELRTARQFAPQASWLLDEMRTTLSQLGEVSRPLRGDPKERLDNDERALPWFRLLAQVDPTDVYAHYAIGRILYDMGDYASCESSMFRVLELSQSNVIRSSAYTYLGLSRVQRGDIKAARDYFFQAQRYDIEFRNNKARQALSGVR